MALNDDIHVLAQVPSLALLDREALRLLAFAGQTRILIAGDVLFRKGDVADGAYVITSGSVALDARDDGTPAAYVVGEGTLLGETAMLVETTRAATAVAREPSSVMKLTREVVLRVLSEFPDSALALRRVIAERLRDVTGELGRVRIALMAIDRE
jgi:CRP-like cAMP-binding protein